jgi:hypothetical protein
MMMRTSLLCVTILTLAVTSRAQSPQPLAALSDQDIHQILVDRIDRDHQSVGIVVGVITPNGRRLISYGHLDANDQRPLTGDTEFEIGSITKVFTSLLLADMVQHGEVALTDPIARYLPAGTKVPERGGRQIALVDLATHTSGLPRLPANIKPKDPANPYADYTVEQLYSFLATYELPRDIGASYEYSNLGGGSTGACGSWSQQSAVTCCQLGLASPCRRGRAAVDRERHAHVSLGKSRHAQVAARAGHGGHAGIAPADRHARSRGGACLARLHARRRRHRLAQRRYRRIPLIHRLQHARRRWRRRTVERVDDGGGG